jgi:hypothetical protein
MHHRLILAGLAATGGLFTTAFLQTAVAAADAGAAAAAGADAFTIGGYTFDPQLASGGEGFDPVAQLTTSPPLLELGGGTVSLGGLSLPLATQDFNVYDPTGTEVGSIQGNETITSLFGLTNGEFTVASVAPVDGGDASTLPTVGSVYDVFNLGNGYENVYVATPGADGTVTDTLVTPFGNEDLSSLFTFNAADPPSLVSRLATSRAPRTPSASGASPWTPRWQPAARASTRSPRWRRRRPSWSSAARRSVTRPTAEACPPSFSKSSTAAEPRLAPSTPASM